MHLLALTAITTCSTYLLNNERHKFFFFLFQGLGSDLYVVKGVEIGQELISASLREPQLEHVEDKIVLTVAEPMFIDPPSPVFVTIGAVVNYQLWVIRLNNLRGTFSFFLITVPSI